MSASGLLAGLDAVLAHVAQGGGNCDVVPVPLAVQLLGAEFGQLDAPLFLGSDLLLVAAGDLAGVAASAVLLINYESVLFHGYTPFYNRSRPAAARTPS